MGKLDKKIVDYKPTAKQCTLFILFALAITTITESSTRDDTLNNVSFFDKRQCNF